MISFIRQSFSTSVSCVISYFLSFRKNSIRGKTGRSPRLSRVADRTSVSHCGVSAAPQAKLSARCNGPCDSLPNRMNLRAHTTSCAPCLTVVLIDWMEGFVVDALPGMYIAPCFTTYRVIQVRVIATQTGMNAACTFRRRA